MNNLADRCNKYSSTRKIFSHPVDCTTDVAIALFLIEDTVGIKTIRAKTLKEYDIPDRLNARLFTRVSEHIEVILVSADDFKRIRGTQYVDHTVFSWYDTENGRIFLVNDLWCYSHLIHEVLHSRSSFSRDEFSQRKNLRFIYEGLTEFLVGVVLKSKLTDCYNDWRIVSHRNPCLSSRYLEFIRPWQFLSWKLTFKEIIDVYFNVSLCNPFESLDQV
jgi:hypothetical protein